mgnify:CR=1 FL=1
MKLVNREEFLSMPVWTIFAEKEENSTPWFIWFLKKWETLGNDYQEISILDDIWFPFSNDWMDNMVKMEEILEEWWSVYLDHDCYWRNWLFDMDQRYIIYEKQDIESIIKELLQFTQLPN